MIIDKIENLNRYDIIPASVIEFIQNLTVLSENKHYELSNCNYVNIEQYYTKNLNDAKYEKHENYIDIQFLITGEEKIYYNDEDNMTKSLGYNKEKDISFFEDKIDLNKFVLLDSSNFVLIYPNEVHAPQVSLEQSQQVKKVVVKLKV